MLEKKVFEAITFSATKNHTVNVSLWYSYIL